MNLIHVPGKAARSGARRAIAARSLMDTGTAFGVMVNPPMVTRLPFMRGVEHVSEQGRQVGKLSRALLPMRLMLSSARA